MTHRLLEEDTPRYMRATDPASPHTGECMAMLGKVLVMPHLHLPDLGGQEDEVPDTGIKMTAKGAKGREAYLDSQFAWTQTIVMEGMQGSERQLIAYTDSQDRDGCCCSSPRPPPSSFSPFYPLGQCHTPQAPSLTSVKTTPNLIELMGHINHHSQQQYILCVCGFLSILAIMPL